MYSKSTQRILKDYKITPQELTFATLYLAGFSIADSYLLAVQPLTNNIAATIGQAKKVANKPNIRTYIQDKQGSSYNEPSKTNPDDISKLSQLDKNEYGMVENGEIEEGRANLDKQQMINELNKLIAKTSDTKLKSELILKLADLTGAKKEQTESEDDAISYYLPITCLVCPKNQP